MKVAVSYLSSKYDFKTTVEKINETSAEFIHVDIMDGKFVECNNINKKDYKYLIKNSSKYLDIHFMTKNPKKYLNLFKESLVKIVYFHPNSEASPLKFIAKAKKMNKLVGIVIDSSESITEFNKYYDLVDYVLVMSVKAGAGGQKFIPETRDKILELDNLKKEKKYRFSIAIDGGVNADSIKLLDRKKIEYVVSGSYICFSKNYDKSVNSLK